MVQFLWPTRESIADMTSYFQDHVRPSLNATYAAVPPAAASPPSACLQFLIHSTFILDVEGEGKERHRI